MRKHFRLIALCVLSSLPQFLQAQWTKTNGLPGGEVGGFQHYGDTVLTNAGDELYFSANHGQTWSTLPSPGGINFYEVTSDAHNILGKKYDPNTGYRLVRSDDFGQTWHSIASVDTMLFYEAFMAFGYVYGSDYHGLYRTNDDGATWEYVLHQQITNVQFDGQRITGLAYPDGVIQSVDGGLTWNSILPLTANVIDMLQNENHLFVFMQYAANGCYASSDYGQTWQHYTGVGFDQVYQFVWHNGSIYAMRGSQIRKSPDLGQTWVNIPLPPDEEYPAFQGVSSGNALMIGGLYPGQSGGILRSTDNGDSWFPASFGIIASAGKLRSIGNDLYAPGPGGVYKLDADKQNWTNQHFNFAPSPYGYGITTDFMQSGSNWLLSEGGVPRVSLDGGVTWYESFVPSLSSGTGVPYFETAGGKVLGLSASSDFSEYFVSENNGLTFQPIESLYDQYQTSITALDVDQGTLYALAYDNKIYRSDDGSTNWTLQSSSIPIDSLGNWGLYQANFMVRGDIMVIIPDTYLKKMLFSKDAGQTWTFINLATAGLPFGDAPFNDLLYIGDYLAAVNTNGIFLSQDNGTTWTEWNNGLEHRNILNLEVHEGYLWAGVSGSGIWKRSLAELGMKSVAGKVYFDENANGQQDPGEQNLGNVVVQSVTTNAFTNTRPDGTYDLLSNLSQEQLKVHPPKPYWVATPATQTVAVPGAGADFALSLNPAAKDLSVELTNVSVLRPGFDAHYVLTWRNNVPIDATGVVVILNFPPDLLDLIEAIPIPSTQSGGTLTWDIGAITAWAGGNILLHFKVPVTDILGTEICATAAITPVAGDLFPIDNNRESCATVVGSYDPNDKQAEPSDFITPAQLANNEPITYTIRFQNTGNFPATFIRIADTLQQNFDPASFEFLSSSHPCTWNMRNQGSVEFFFNNIQLPPVTTDEPGSHGFVKYSVRPRQNLPLGAPLPNTAHIYFDYNAPVVTNTTETVVGLVKTSTPDDENNLLRLSPNPASRLVAVETNGQAGELLLQDATGRVVLRQFMDNSIGTLSVEELPQGVYQVLFFGGKTTQRGQLVVLR